MRSWTRLPPTISSPRTASRPRRLSLPGLPEKPQAVWNSNGIHEMEKMTDKVELYVIAPCHYLVPEEVRFELRGVHYYFFQDKPSYLHLEVRKRLFKRYEFGYERNRAYIKNEIEDLIEGKM